jgi:transposase InsO family protein
MLKQKPPERRVMFLSAGQDTEAPFLGGIEVKMLEGKPETVEQLMREQKLRTGRHRKYVKTTDRGIQYCSKEFRTLLNRLCPSARQSMRRKGNYRDNACAESFFKTLKVELDILDGNHNLKDVKIGILKFIITDAATFNSWICHTNSINT